MIVDLYPFEQTVASGAEEQAVIEKIDIGGISLIRAAAKNFKDVVIVPSVDQYAEFYEIITANNALRRSNSAVVSQPMRSTSARTTIRPSSTISTAKNRSARSS